MYKKAKCIVMLIVLCFACLIPGLESSPARECPDIVNYKYEDPITVADITVPAPPRRGVVRLEFTYRVPTYAMRGSEGKLSLLDEDDYSTQSDNLRYRMEFDFGDVTPAIVSILLNGRIICSPLFDVSQSIPTTLATVSHYISYGGGEETSYVQPNEKDEMMTPIPVENYQNSASDEDECGVPHPKPIQLIFHGKDTQRGDWPWLVPLFHLPGLNFTCGSTIVSLRHVITAAHCVMKNEVNMSPREVVLKIGAFNLGRFREKHTKLEKLKSIEVHEDYEPFSSANDLAILKTMNPITVSEYVKPVCLWKGDSDQYKILRREAVVIGWGKTQDGTVSAIPQTINVPIVSLEECRASHVLLNRIASDNTLCAGSRDGTGPCNGDSGGGLLLKEGNRWRLRGIISASVDNDDKCGLGHFVLYTDLAKYAGWLRRRMQ